MEPSGHESSPYRLCSLLDSAKAMIVFISLHMFICSYTFPRTKCWVLAYLLCLTPAGVGWVWGEADMFKGRDWLGSSCMVPSDNRSAWCLWWAPLLSCGLFFGLWAQRDFAKPFPRHVSLCVVRRDWDGDAVISRPSFLLSLVLSLHLSEFISLSLVLRKRVTEGAKCHGTESERGEREMGRGRKETEVVYLAVFVTLLPWLRSSSLPKAAAS